MSQLEERLRVCLRRIADESTPPRGWAIVRARALRRRHRRTAIVAGLMFVVVTAALGTLFIHDADNNRAVSTGASTPPVVIAPGRTRVVAAANGRVVVLNPANGRVLRTLASGPDAVGVNAVTGTPDGNTVYLGSGTPTCAQGGGGTGFAEGAPKITRFSAPGGPLSAVADGFQPHVSPDGRYLAFGTARGDAPSCLHYDVLVVRDLTTGTEARLDYGPTQQTIAPVAWAPDSTRLLVVGAGGNPSGEVAVTPSGLQKGRQVITPLGFGPRYLPNGELVYAQASGRSTRIETIDPATGNPGRTVSNLSAPLELVDVDQAGTGFLLFGPPTEPTKTVVDLYRASLHHATPVKLINRVTAAAWLPGHETGTPASPVVPPGIQGVTTLPVSGGLTDLGVGDGSLWVPGSGVVQRVDPTTGRFQHEIPVKGASDYRYVTVGAGGVWVTDSGTQRVTRIDPSTNRIVATITLNETPERAIAIADGRLWVAYTSSAGSGVVVIDPRTNRASTPIPFSRLGTSMVTGDGHVWVSDGLMVARDDSRQHLAASFRLPPASPGLQLVAAGDRALWLIGPRGTPGVVRLDTTTIDSPTFSPVASVIPIPQAVEVAVTQNAIWVLTNRNDQTADRPGQLWELDPNTLKTVGSPITVGTTPVRLLATPNTVWVANSTDSTITRIALRPER